MGIYTHTQPPPMCMVEGTVQMDVGNMKRSNHPMGIYLSFSVRSLFLSMHLTGVNNIGIDLTEWHRVRVVMCGGVLLLVNCAANKLPFLDEFLCLKERNGGHHLRRGCIYGHTSVEDEERHSNELNVAFKGSVNYVQIARTRNKPPKIGKKTMGVEW